MDVAALRYSDELHKVDWSNIFHQILPYISNHRRNVLGHISGQFSINPLLIVGKIIQDQQRAINYNMASDEEFRISFTAFSNTLSQSEQDYDAEEKDIDISPLEYVLRKTIGNSDELIRNFIRICDAISKEYNIPTATSDANIMSSRNIMKRANDDEISLQLPYTHSECWQLGGSHFGAQETQSSATNNGILSAIDMSPYLFSVSILISLYFCIYSNIYIQALYLFYILSIFLSRNGEFRLISYTPLERCFLRTVVTSRSTRIVPLRWPTTSPIIPPTIVISCQTISKTVYLLKVARASVESALIPL